MADISIPEGDNPVRYQASLGGNQKYRNMGNVSGQAYLVRGQVTNVYYQKGTLDFNTYGSSVTSGVTDGSGSAPIPVDFWGKNTDGKVFGCYRPVQKGSQILVAYIGGDTSRPIVIGVYPDNEASYELISPVHYNTSDDSTDDVQNDALGERKIYPNQQMMYESGKGDILRSMGGKSFLYISENGSGYLDDINYAYDEIRDFYDAEGNEIEPTMTKAQSWLLVHEDNDSDEESDGHRTRFYVNRSGELMVTFANNNDPNEIVVLEASKDSGFKLTKRFDNSNLKEDSEDYVQFGIGNGNNVSIKSVDSGDATSFYLDNGNIKLDTPKEGSITFDGVPVSAILGRVSDAENVANNASDKADIAARAGETAKSAASEAASQALAASYAGEDAKSAAVDAQAAGEDAKAQAKDTRDRIIYYSSISNEKDVAIPGKYIIVNTDTYIKDGTIKTAHIGDAAITNAKIADLAVGTAQLEDAAITRAKIGNLAVGTAQIEDAAITDAKVGDLSADHLKAGTIDFSVISGIHINASEIDVGKIVADQIFVNGLGDISKNLGTVTSGKITGTNVNDDINTVQSGVNDLNNPNLMSVIEKQTASKQFAGLTSQYNVILARAKDDNISTTDLTTTYTNLDNFITPLLKDTTKASEIDRYTYNSLTYAYNTALSNVQAALKDAYNTDISNMYTSVAVASQAASSAAIVASQAATTGDNASHAAEQARIAASQAQIAGDNATSVANNASQAASGAVIAGSTASVNADKAVKVANQAKSAGDNATSVANTASQAASGAVIAGSTAAVIANKASTVANEAKSAGDNATSVANNATSVANSAKSTADSTYAYANSEIAVQSNATAKAQSTADNAFSQAQAVGSQASADISSNSTATAKAQSTADNAFSQATTAIDNGKVTSQAVTDLKDGSKLTIAELENGLATKVANSDYASYKEQTASQIGQLVTNGAFSAYQTQTADLIAQKVATSDFSAYQATTAKAIESKVESSDFNTYKTQTADLIDDKVSSSQYSSDKTQTASEIADRVSNSAFSTYQTQTASQIASKVDNGDFSTYKTQTANLIGSKVDNGVYQSDKTQTANAISSKVSSSDFNTYKTQTDSAISSKVESSNFQALQTQVNDSSVGTNLLANTADNGVGLVSIQGDNSVPKYTSSITRNDSYIEMANNMAPEMYYRFCNTDSSMHNLKPGQTYTIQGEVYVSKGAVRFRSQNEVNGGWTDYSGCVSGGLATNTSGFVHVNYTFTVPSNATAFYLSWQVYNFDSTTVFRFRRMKLEIGSNATDYSTNPLDNATQSQITQLSGEIDLRVTKGDLVDQINIQAGKTLISSSGQLILSGKSVVLDSVDPVIMKSANIGNMAVGTAQIANGAITNAQIGSLAVDTANIKDAAISSAKIANLAVGTAQIGDGAITNAKIGKLAVGTAQIANGAITDAQIGSLAVGTAQIKDEAVNSAKIAKLAVGTAQIGDGAITTAKIGKLAVGTAQIADAAITDAQIGNVSANKLTAGTIDFNTITGKNINASNITTGKLSTKRLNVDKLSAVSANLGDVTTGSLKGVDIVANTFSTPNGSFTTDSNGNVVASNLTIRGVTNLVYNAALLGGNGSSIPGWGISNNGYYSNQSLHDGVPSIGYHNNTGAGAWVNFAQSKLYSLNGRTGIPYSASVWFLEVGSYTNLKYQFTLAFFDANGNRLDSGYVGNTWNGIGSRQDWRYVTINNAVSPSTAVYVAIQYWAYNGSGYGLFSSPMLTQTAQATGYQPDVGNIINAGEINGTVINGSTFHGGSIISNSNNTAHYYPMTITPDGMYNSTYFDNAVGMQSSVESGGISYKYRSMIADGSGQYLSYDSVVNGQGFQSQSGYTSAKDTTFSNSETISGYVNVTPSSGIYLYGPTQQINFAGRRDNIGSNGITMDAYGNVYSQDNSAWWRIGLNDGSHIVDFGIDKAGQNQIYFYRDINMGNININRAHSITTQDGQALYINSGKGGRADLNVASLNYTGSVSKSLLSEKKDVKKVDTSYWAQLVNSIDLATYQYKDDDNISNLRLSGIVDDVNEDKQWNLPDIFVARDEDGKLAGIENIVLQNAMLATIQEQQKEIDKLNGHLLELEAKLNG